MRTIVLALAVLLVAFDAAAHDFWLAASPWSPATGARVTVTANSGDVFPKGTSFTAPDRVDQWRVIGSRGEVPAGREFRREGDSLATDVQLPAAGVYLGVMLMQSRVGDMKGPSFTEYLEEEGLTGVIEQRRAAGQSEATAHERYTRYAKVVVRNGAGDGAHVTRPVGLKSELVPAVDPSALRAGDSLTVQLLTDGEAVGGALMTAISPAGRVTARTDAGGKATLALAHAGPWLVRTVHMVPVTPAGESKVDWESFWATLSFEVPNHR